MACYDVNLRPSARKDLCRLSRDIVRRIMARVDELQSAPFPVGARRLSGSDELYRVRVGDYRIVYEVDEEQGSVAVHYIRHRREVYRAL